MPKLYINLFKEYRDLNSSFNSFKDFKNLSDYYKLFVFLTDSSSYKLHSTLELMEGNKFYLHKDQLGTPRAKHKIIKRPFKIEIYAYKLFFCGIPARLDIHINHDYTFYYRYTFSNSLEFSEKGIVKSSIANKFSSDSVIDLDRECLIDSKQTILNLEDGDELKVHFHNSRSEIFKDLKNYEELFVNSNL